jgi:hypothetical protein
MISLQIGRDRRLRAKVGTASQTSRKSQALRDEKGDRGFGPFVEEMTKAVIARPRGNSRDIIGL